MKYCCVPGCKSKSTTKPKKKLLFFNLPTDKKSGVVDPLKRKRRHEWIKAIHATKMPASTLQNMKVCSKHFVTGRPAGEDLIYHRDWVPTVNMPRIVLEKRKQSTLENIIDNLPEVVQMFDAPDYVILDKVKFNERKIEMDLVKKYITNPAFDQHGSYNNDHDYLGLPILATKPKTPRNEDHSYSINHPACLYFDSRHFCNICRATCENLFIFNNHMMSHTLRNHVDCGICPQRFLTTTCLNTHLATHTDLCEMCGKEVPTMQLSAHQWFNRRQKRNSFEHFRYKVPSTQKVYFCIFCMKKFSSQNEYCLHLILHHKRAKKT